MIDVNDDRSDVTAAPVGAAEPAAALDDSRVVRAVQEYMAALEAGQKPDRQEFLARHADIAAVLAGCLAGLEFVQSAASQLHAPGDHALTEAGPDLHPAGPLGDFQILREVGRGGMGIVYEAVQISLGRRVALKVLPFAAALDAKQIQRFKNEAQAAAGLHHQHIVPVYAVGCERGMHFYAMQFIDGQTLAQTIADCRLRTAPIADCGLRIADSKKGASQGAEAAATGPYPAEPALESAIRNPQSAMQHLTGVAISTEPSARGPADFRTVARLGVQAAEALEHAHQLGVVHRDIKPANLLVDGRANLWVTDFGLAHCQSQQGLTMTGDLVGTLRYMSPEQALANLALVDHRTDVYSLGATLYELLTLEPAFPGRDRQELLRQIGFEEPRPPRSLNRAVPAELETIVLKAMEKNPAERYATAQELADDLERWLKDEPIRARRPTLLQRGRKWARRHGAVVWAAGISLAVLLVTVIVGLTVGLLAVEHQRQKTDLANLALTDEQQRTKDALDREAKRRLQAQQALDTLSSKLIDDWLAMQRVLLPDHKQFLEQALQLYEQFAVDTGQDEVARAAVAGAHVRVGIIRYVLGQMQQAEAAYQRGHALYAALAAELPRQPRYRWQLAQTEGRLATLFSGTGRAQQAEQAYRRAVEIQERLTGEFPLAPEYWRDLASSYFGLASLFDQTGRRPEAEKAFGQALTIWRRLVKAFPRVPDYRMELARGQNNHGISLANGGRLQEAEEAFREAVALGAGLANEFPNDRAYRRPLANFYNSLGKLLGGTGRPEEEEVAYGQALAILKPLAADFPAVPEYRLALARSLMNLGVLLQDTRRPQRAEEAYAQALALLNLLAADYPTVPEYRHNLAMAHFNLGRLLLQSGRTRDAEGHYRAALPILNQLAGEFPKVPDYQWDLGTCHSALGVVLKFTGRVPAAEKEYRTALGVLKPLAAAFSTVPDYQSGLAVAMVNLAALLAGRKEFADARRLLEDALPYHHRALQANRRHLMYRLSLHNNRLALTMILVEQKQHIQAAAAVAQFLQSAVDPANDAYKGACFLALCMKLAEDDKQLPEAQRRQRATVYGDDAVAALKQASAGGFHDVAQVEKDANLDPLRARKDFQAWLAELEAKTRR
jgi:serine/threonine protein kinase